MFLLKLYMHYDKDQMAFVKKTVPLLGSGDALGGGLAQAVSLVISQAWRPESLLILFGGIYLSLVR